MQRAAQLVKREKQRARDRPRVHQPGALELRDHYAALPDEEDLRPLSTRMSPRRGRAGEGAAPAPKAPAADVFAEDRRDFEAGIDSDSEGGFTDEEERDGAAGVPPARSAADGGAAVRSGAARGGGREDLAMVCLRLRQRHSTNPCKTLATIGNESPNT